MDEVGRDWGFASRRALALRSLIVVAAMLLGGEGIARACTTAAECPLPGAPCELCADGASVCPAVSCTSGQCVYSFPTCPPGVCAPDLSWCPLNGRCVAPACLACCQFGTSCATASDCGTACVSCADGSKACSAGACGVEQPGQCFFAQPVCPSPPPSVPATPAAFALAAAGLLALLGARRARR
jgi:hypothetical protein